MVGAPVGPKPLFTLLKPVFTPAPLLIPAAGTRVAALRSVVGLFVSAQPTRASPAAIAGQRKNFDCFITNDSSALAGLDG